MAKKAKKKRVGSHIFWRNGRAYGDFRDYSDVGGGRAAFLCSSRAISPPIQILNPTTNTPAITWPPILSNVHCS